MSLAPEVVSNTEKDDLLPVLAKRFDDALSTLSEAESFAKARYQTDAFRLATDLMEREGGLALVYARAPLFDEVGLFYGGPWQDPTKLIPTLVSAGLKGEALFPTLEALSELRLLSLATGQHTHPDMSAAEAREFLKSAMALNLDFLFPEPTEDSRLRPKVYQRAIALFALIQSHLSLEGLQEQLLQEIEFLLAQRPIQNARLLRLMDYVNKLPREALSGEASQKLERYNVAMHTPSPLSQQVEGDVAAYRKALMAADADTLAREIQDFAEALQLTGIGTPCHAVLLRYLLRKSPGQIPEALAMDNVSLASFEAHQDFAKQLIKVAIFPATANAIYGYAQVIRRGLLSRPEVANALLHFVELDLSAEVRSKLLATQDEQAGLTANALLLAGTLNVLGQPLGIGQGNSPTCQAARGLSLWAQHAPGYLLQIITTAARNDVVEMDFEGTRLRSDLLVGGVASGQYDASLDPVSMILVPHLDRLYDEMMRQASLRGEDQHKWVNPMFYGRWVSKGFACVYDVMSNAIKDYATFVRRFFATHHPEYNDGSPLVYPNPVGIYVTDIHGNLLGLHAVSIQRIVADPEGCLRVYFFNPNNEGRQQWGSTIETSVSGYGEKEGESSLPFEHFASRLYAFHYNPFEEGDAYAVPTEIVQRLEQEARESWGRSYTWS